MNLTEGFHFVGRIVQFEMNEWAPNKFNQILVLDNPYEDRYGSKNSNYTRVNIHRDDVQVVREMAEKNRGALVRINIAINLKSGISNKNQQPYAFNDFYKPKGTEVELITPKLAKVS